MWRNIRKRIALGLFLGAGLLVMTACGGSERKAGRVARDFLQAYYVDLNYDRAVELSTDISHAAIRDQQEITAMNPYAKEEVPDIVFRKVEIDKDNTNRAICTYTSNRVEKTLPLRKLDGLWLIHLQSGSVETGGFDNGLIELSSGGQGGFASAASGPVTYKKKDNNR